MPAGVPQEHENMELPMSVEEKSVQLKLDPEGALGAPELIDLTYLESVADSSGLVIYLHGMGLDADDFRALMDHDVAHGIALTLPGFTGGHDANVKALSLSQHAEVVSRFVIAIRDEYPGKDISLVGFSLGADLILRLAEFWHEQPTTRSNVDSVLLLDPNINHSTMHLSGVLAHADERNPIPEMKRVITSVDAKDDFAHICSYIGKIASKNFLPIKQHARDFWSWWRPAGDYMLFVTRLLALCELAGNTRVVFSSAYEAHMTTLAGEFDCERFPRLSCEVTDLGHFDLIGEDLLSRELTKMR
ncbi:MAG: alpha/beta fold hydrolase [Actinomycetota bacterium]|nr:alpha/beta fold hydrolase [Actinomycetota bacterium]